MKTICGNPGCDREVSSPTSRFCRIHLWTRPVLDLTKVERAAAVDLGRPTEEEFREMEKKSPVVIRGRVIRDRKATS